MKNTKVSASISIAPDSCEFDNIPESCEFQSLISASFEVCLSLASFQGQNAASFELSVHASFSLRVWHYFSSCEFGSKFCLRVWYQSLVPASLVSEACEF